MSTAGSVHASTRGYRPGEWTRPLYIYAHTRHMMQSSCGRNMIGLPYCAQPTQLHDSEHTTCRYIHISLKGLGMSIRYRAQQIVLGYWTQVSRLPTTRKLKDAPSVTARPVCALRSDNCALRILQIGSQHHRTTTRWPTAPCRTCFQHEQIHLMKYERAQIYWECKARGGAFQGVAG